MYKYRAVMFLTPWAMIQQHTHICTDMYEMPTERNRTLNTWSRTVLGESA